MKIRIIAIVIMLLVTPILAQPELEVFTDRCLYNVGEEGTIFVKLNTFGLLQEAEMEVVVLGPKNTIIDGTILYTEIPEKTTLSSDQTEQILIEEGFGYLLPEKTIIRTVDFGIPRNVPIGDYKVTARVVSSGLVLEKSTTISILGQGALDAMGLIYVMIIILILGIKYYE